MEFLAFWQRDPGGFKLSCPISAGVDPSLLPRCVSVILFLFDFEGRPSFVSYGSVWMVYVKFCLPKIIFEDDLFIYFWVRLYTIYFGKLSGTLGSQKGIFLELRWKKADL